MARKFKCKDCRHSFQLNNGEDEICPKCKSDNILPVGNGMSILGKLLLFLVMATVGYFATDIILKNNNDKKLVAVNVSADEISSDVDTETGKEPVSDDLLSSGGVQTDMTIVEEPMEPIDSAEFNLTNITLKQNGFSFIVQCEKIPVDYQIEQYRLFLSEDDEAPKLVAEANGVFSSDTYFSEDGKYFVQAVFINNNTTTRKPIEGIVKPVSQKEETKPVKMEMSELQSKIDKSVAERNGGSPVNKWYKPQGGDSRVSKKVRISLSSANNVKGEDKQFVGVQPMIKYGQSQKVGIRVLSVSYNSDSVIDAFEIATTK